MHCLAQRPVAQEWAAVFREANRVDQNFCRRLWRGARMAGVRR